MKKPILRGTSVLAAITITALIAAGAASAHANVSPPIVKAKVSQVYTLAVPTEKENATTVKVELTPPSGFSIDSFEPTPGWKRAEASTGSGDSTKITKVTWTGPGVPTGEDAVFRFLGQTDSAKTYDFGVRQTYSDGEVVDRNGPETSDAPSPTVDSVSSLGGGSGSTLAVIAIVVAGVAVVLGAVSLLAGRRTLA